MFRAWLYKVLASFVALTLAACGSMEGTASPTSTAPLQYTGSSLVHTFGLNAAAQNIPPSFFGMTIERLAPDVPGVTAGLTPFPAFPVSLLRLWDVDYWAVIESTPGSFDWAKMDQTIAIAQRHGVKDFIFTFGHLPAWASTQPADPCDGGYGPGSCAPPNIAAFDDFVTHVVQRYCGVVRYYETWNEPDFSGYWDGTDAQLLIVAKHVYRIAKDPANCSANNGPTPNQVITPSVKGISQNSVTWLDTYLGAAGPTYPYADIASFHGYGFSQPEALMSAVQQLKAILTRHGLGDLPLWNTEASWGSEDSQTDQQRAAWLLRYHAALALSGVSRFAWYAYDDCQWGTLWVTSACTGVSGDSAALNAPGRAYAVAESWLAGANLALCNQYENGLWACELNRSQGYTAWMLWSTAATSIAVSIPANTGLTVYRDWQNQVAPLPRHISVTGMPVLLETQDLP